MTGLTLSLLGGIDIQRDGRSLTLPPSKKTRALLAYLALHERSFSRQHLCELLWDLPDDPRGSLRWSLSKLRRLVDDDVRQRIVADRNNVRFDRADISIDVLALRKLAAQAASSEVTTLEQAVEKYQGNFAEGLELANHHTFHAWCISARDQVNQAQAVLLGTLMKALFHEPTRALPYARRLVNIVPYDESARVKLIQLLVKQGRIDEGEQQYKQGVRLFEEIGQDVSASLFQALRGPPGKNLVPVQPGNREVNKPEAKPLTNTTLVGRDAELSSIQSLIETADGRGSPKIILLKGSPGIGKTRLLEHTSVIAARHGVQTLAARSFESDSIRPFALWMDALRKDYPEVVADVFQRELKGNRERLFDRLSTLIRRMTGAGPVLLLFDDIQWCDESSSAALHFVSRMNTDRAVIALVAARTDELHDNAAFQKTLRGFRHDKMLDEIELPPLSDTDIAQLISANAPDIDIAALSSQCGGNPLLAIELARAESHGTSASSLIELIRERLSRFDHASAEVMRWAAVMSPRLDSRLLSDVTRLEPYAISEAMEFGMRQSLLQSDELGFQFTHDLIARSLYNEISPQRRRIMHKYIAQWLEKNAGPGLHTAADLSYHAAQSGNAGLAARSMVAAGKLCLRFFANDDALGLANKGLGWAEKLPDPEQLQVKLELHDIIVNAAPLSDWQAAAREYAQLAEAALDYGAISHARLGYQLASYVRWMHGHWAGAREEALQAARVTRGGTESEQIIGMAETAKCLAMIERDLFQAEALVMEVDARARRIDLVHAAIPTAKGLMRFHENKLDEAEEYFRDARNLYKSEGDRIGEFQVMENIVLIAIERGQYDHASSFCHTLQELGENLRVGSEGPYSTALCATCHYAQTGDSSQLPSALEKLRSLDAKHRMACVLNRVAGIDLRLKKNDQAVSNAKEALQLAETLERASEMMLAHVVLATALQANPVARASHISAIEGLTMKPIAVWARLRGERLLKEVVL